MTGKRVHERVEIELVTRLTLEGRDISGVSQNLSLGGMFLVTDEPLPYGAQVAARFRLPALKEDTVVQCVVRWTKPEGVGIQFGSLRAIDVWGINQLFRNSG